MTETINPLIPAGYDIAWSVAALVGVVLLVIALVSIGRDSSLTAGQRLVWVLLAIFLPVVGPVAWLVAGRRATAARAQD
ncbi:PLDc N-terminal domain-containing protein [Microbacterium sp. NC79]|uniref:PLDc N-terminal domain-containing protein n=1 Tax=Microbacterium sp. NC79 TaxID=2851009 RepID=UPI001C2C23D2|nr:PLDc N-terminal domain-containing protein [Microbacterium sp. NC79]MBV0893893.1 PLDc N-terminal domain-containing protein [Microbacterium sp. NC79]